MANYELHYLGSLGSVMPQEHERMSMMASASYTDATRISTTTTLPAEQLKVNTHGTVGVLHQSISPSAEAKVFASCKVIYT